MIQQWVWGIAVSPFSAWPCLVACWTIPACIKTQWELKITRALLRATEVIFSTQWLHHFRCETDCFPWSNPLALITDPSDPTLPLPLAYSQCGWLPNMVHIPSGRELLHSPLAWSRMVQSVGEGINHVICFSDLFGTCTLFIFTFFLNVLI